MPYFRQRSPPGAAASPSFSTAMICSSVYLLAFIESLLTYLLLYGNSKSNWPGFWGQGQLPHFILVPAVRDVSDEAKVTKTNPLGRLVYAIIESVTEAQKVTIGQSLKQM